MTKKRVMLLGSSGQIGQAIRASALPIDWELGAFGHNECDITNHRNVQDVIQKFKPDIVINCAGMTAVDLCETEQEKAMATNFDAPANLAAQCSALDAPLIHLSTDYVFDGTDGARPYKPDDAMNPQTIYGQGKMMGEEALRHEHPWHVILRVSSVFSAFGHNLLTRTLERVETQDEIKIVADQISCPTPAPSVATTLIQISDAILGGKSNGFGVFHYCGTPAVSRHGFTEEIIKAYGSYTTKRPKLLKLEVGDLPNLAPRPSYSVLDCSKILEIYKITQPSWHEGLSEAIEKLMQNRKKVA